MRHRRFLIESAKKLLRQAQDEKGDSNETWAIRNALLSLSILKSIPLKEPKNKQSNEHRHD